MKLKEIISIIETYFPTESAMEWDNVGLLLGDREREIKKVLLTLDITYDIIEQAKAAGAELIWSHHPVMFSPVQKITTDTGLGRLLLCAFFQSSCIILFGKQNQYICISHQLRCSTGGYKCISC